MIRTLSRWAAGCALVLCATALTACTDDDEPTSEPSPTAPTGSPFSATLEGPDVAAPGDRLTVTLTNTGRLPDRYQLKVDPQDAADFDPLEVSLGPGESADVTVTVGVAPLIVSAESIGGGSGVSLAELSIGSQGGG